MLTYKMCQDHLELLFGAGRAHGGCSNNPTIKQFQTIYKRLMRNEVTNIFNNNILIYLLNIIKYY